MRRRHRVERGDPLLIEGSSGCQIAAGLLPASDIELDASLLLGGGVQAAGPNEVIMYKPRWGAFYQSPLEPFLNQLEVSTLVFMGCNFPNCPRASIDEASERDYRIVLVADAVSGLYEREQEEMEMIEVKLFTAEELIGVLRTRKVGHESRSSEARIVR